MDKQQFETICRKLDKITALLMIKNIEEKNDKINSLKKLGLSSVEVAELVGMTDNGIRSSEGWKRK